MDEQSWALVRWMVLAWVGYMTVWVGLGRQARSELGRRVGSTVVCVGGMGQGSGLMRVELRGGLAAVRG